MKTNNILDRIKRLRNLRRQGCKAFLLFSLSQSLILLGSCSEWNDHYEPALENGGNATLWQQMKANPQLSDFCEVLEKTRTFRMHKKTEVSYAQLLNGGQAFTVIAPVNGTFNKDSLLRMVETAKGDSMVEKSFVFNHLSRVATSLKPVPQQLHLLNGKYVSMTESTIQDVPIVKANQRASNGILHVAARALPYHYNLYEALCDDPDVSAIGANLRQYEWDEFDPGASVTSGIIEGVPVYIDSVVHAHNRIVETIGLINAEDSLYWAVVPTNEGWQKAWDRATRYFVYDKSYQRADSLQRYWTNRALLDDAIFNMTDQRSTNDSLVSVPYLNWRRGYVEGKPWYHVFKNPFAAGGILHQATPLQCSNGILYKTAEWPFTPEQTFFKQIWTEGEATWLIIDEKSCRYERLRQVADSISENTFLQVLATSGTANWELTYRLDNVLSGEYDICAIILPKTVINPDEEKLRPCKFRAVVNYVDEEGKQQSYNCENTQFQTHPERVDTVVLAEAFRFPTTNFNQTTNKVSLTLKCYITARETSNYSREMLLDCIYLRPRTSKPE